MLDRYSTPAMREVWSKEHRLGLLLDVELAWLEALEEDGIAPRGSAAAVRRGVRLDPARVEALEGTLRHDVIAFLAHCEEQVGEASRFLHYGLTSSDVLDTAFALQLREANTLIVSAMERLARALSDTAVRHRTTPMMGRTHGMHAEVTTFGLVAAGWRSMVVRAIERVSAAAAGVAVGKLSGAVGTHAFGDPAREERVLARLGLGVEPVATQVVARDRHAAYFAALAVAAAAMEKVATDIRHLQRTEVSEVAEPFGAGQRGSSAMPHKRNPVLCENVCGLARVVRAAAMAALEDVALWHERDISHSSVERVIGPDSTATTEFMALRLAEVVEGLEVRPDRMAANIGLGSGLWASEGVLLALVRSGMMRQEAYAVVQRAALRAAAGQGTFRDNLAAQPEVATRLSGAELDECLSGGLRWVDALLRRAGL